MVKRTLPIEHREAKRFAHPNREDGCTPLRIAGGDVDGMRALLDAGADPTLRRIDRTSALMWAAAWGDVDGVRALLAAGSDPNGQTMAGRTALMDATGSGHVACVRALLDAGADPNAQDQDGETPLMDAAYQGRVVGMRALLDAGADPSIQCYEGGSVKGIVAQCPDPTKRRGMEALLRTHSIRGELLRRVWRSSGAVYRAYLRTQTSAPDEALLHTVLRTRRFDEALMARVWRPDGRLFAYYQLDSDI